jgi:Tfp pilus assembly protein PilX
MQSRRVISFPDSQRGLTLLVGLIMLVLTTLIVLASFHLGRSNLEIVGNAQHRDEGLSAAQQTIETAVNSPLLTTSPAAIFPTPCAGFPNNTLCYDVNGDGTNDVVVQITPTPKCVKAQPIPLTQLNLADANDQLCTVGVNQGGFGVGGATLNSSCANTVWDVRAVAQDLDPSGTAAAGQGASAVVNQGIAVRVSTDDVATSCP